jgi:hypothetical protein
MAYQGTSVSVERSKEAIRKLLIASDARGVQFSEDFKSGAIEVRFAKLIGDNMRTVRVGLAVKKPEKRAPRRGRWHGGHYRAGTTDAERMAQAERATYRALYYWLKSQFEAVAFGLLSFEDVFLSHFEWMVGGHRTTVGALVLPHLQDGSNFLPSPKGEMPEDDGTVEGSFKQV